MAIKVVVVLMLLAVIASLFSGLFFLLRDGQDGRRTVRALTVRIALSLALFALLMIGFQTGLLDPR
ncbi:MAG: twin transmembrane helix small protein [Sterolibacterium sp.]